MSIFADMCNYGVRSMGLPIYYFETVKERLRVFVCFFAIRHVLEIVETPLFLIPDIYGIPIDFKIVVVMRSGLMICNRVNIVRNTVINKPLQR